MANPFFRITTKVATNFEAIERSTARDERQYLFRVGGYALRVAKSLLKNKKTRYSNPGDPPSGKTGSMRRGMAFAVEMNDRSVIIGPRRDNSKDNSLVLHEYGGQRVVSKGGYVPIPKSAVRTDDIDPAYPVRESKKRAHVRVFLPAGVRNYPARPYMAPSLKKTIEQDQTKFWVGVG